MIYADFWLNNKKYIFFIEDNNLKYGYLDDGNIQTTLTKEEIELMDKIIPYITISTDSNSHVALNLINYNNKKFQIIYDRISDLKYFYEIKDNKYHLPEIEDTKYLWRIYNANNYVFYNESSKEELERKTVKTIKTLFYGAVVIITVQLATLGIMQFNIHQKQKELETLQEQIVCNWEDVNSAILSNTNLNEEEKAFILGNQEMVEENRDFINKQIIVDRLEDLDIIYLPDSSKQEQGVTELVLGFYNVATNEITVFGTDCYENCDKDVLSHEVKHVLSNSVLTAGSGINEAINQMMTKEYKHELCGNQFDTYIDLQKATMALAEIIGTEPLKQFYFRGDINYIRESLNEIINDYDKADLLIWNIDCIQIYSGGFEIGLTQEEMLKNKQESANNTYNLLKEYFYEKYQYPLEEDLVMMSYLSDSIFSDKKIDLNGDTTLEKVDPKGYFSSEAINENPNVIWHTSRMLGEEPTKPTISILEEVVIENERNINKER